LKFGSKIRRARLQFLACPEQAKRVEEGQKAELTPGFQSLAWTTDIAAEDATNRYPKGKVIRQQEEPLSSGTSGPRQRHFSQEILT
jgi:hypothetical protein